MITYSAPVENFINNFTVELLDGMDIKLVTTLIEIIGGEEVFLASYRHIDTNGSLSLMHVFETPEEVHDFYNENKTMILDHCAESAWRDGEESAIQKVAHFSQGRGYTLDQVADALFGNHSGKPFDDIEASIRNITICTCIDDMSRAYVEYTDKTQ